MAESYINPSSMYPLQTPDNNSPAFGSGTVPGSFLAGSMLPQRLNDYNQAFDASMTSSRLANLKSQADLENYLAGQKARNAEYGLKEEEAKDLMQLHPGAQKLALGKQKAELEAAPIENEMRVWSATASMKQAQRAAVLKEMTTAGDLLRGIPDDAPVSSKVQFLRNAGVDVSHMEGLPENVQQQHLQFLKNLDPKVFEHLSRMEEIKEQGAQHVKYGETIGGYRLKSSEVMAAARVKAGEKPTPAQLEHQYYDIGGRIANGEDVSPEERFLFDNFVPTQGAKAGAKAEAEANAKAQIPNKEITAIQRERAVQKDAKERFLADPQVGSNKLGPWDPKVGGYEVRDPETGKLLGHYK